MGKLEKAILGLAKKIIVFENKRLEAGHYKGMEKPIQDILAHAQKVVDEKEDK